jgi:mono/diheme cytochrome c family protein
LASELNWNATMTKVHVLASGSVAVALLLSATLFANPPSQTPEPTRPSGPHGSYLFTTYCAVCHGTSARGDGPLADSMRKRPANLTEIAKRNNGVFPTEMVHQIIDGRRPVRGHGGPDMPVWGDGFLRSQEAGDEKTVKERIDAIVSYLESIQLRSTQ